jgi:hypothetical protein
MISFGWSLWRRPPQSKQPLSFCLCAKDRNCRLARAGWGCSVGEQCSPEMDTISFQALSNQQKAVLMSERVMGIEHPNTIQEYVSSQAGVGL